MRLGLFPASSNAPGELISPNPSSPTTSIAWKGAKHPGQTRGQDRGWLLGSSSVGFAPDLSASGPASSETPLWVKTAQEGKDRKAASFHKGKTTAGFTKEPLERSLSSQRHQPRQHRKAHGFFQVTVATLLHPCYCDTGAYLFA